MSPADLYAHGKERQHIISPRVASYTKHSGKGPGHQTPDPRPLQVKLHRDARQTAAFVREIDVDVWANGAEEDLTCDLSGSQLPMSRTSFFNPDYPQIIPYIQSSRKDIDQFIFFTEGKNIPGLDLRFPSGKSPVSRLRTLLGSLLSPGWEPVWEVSRLQAENPSSQYSSCCVIKSNHGILKKITFLTFSGMSSIVYKVDMFLWKKKI